jgi:hypothetical protein
MHVHGLPQLLAGLDVEKRHGEENYGEQQHERILHRRTPGYSRIGLVDDPFAKQAMLPKASGAAGAPNPFRDLPAALHKPSSTSSILSCAGFEDRKEFLKKP